MKREELVSNLSTFGYRLVSPETHRNKKYEVFELLEELADSEDPRLVEGFPVVLANCAHQGLDLNFSALLSRQKPGGRRQQDLEMLLLASSDLLKQQGLDQPGNLESLSKTLKTKYADLLSNDLVPLSNKVFLSTERLSNTLKRYTTEIVTSKKARKREKDRQSRSFQLNYYLSTLFAPKQKELVLKKYHGEPLNKTEQEYFSRSVKKKLEAMTNKDVMKVAKAFTKKR
jgi:hypothetical protein